MRYCPKCNTSNEDDALDCIQCHAKLHGYCDEFQTIDLTHAPLSADAKIEATLDIDTKSQPIAMSFDRDKIFDGDFSNGAGDSDASQTVESRVGATDGGSDREATVMFDDQSPVQGDATQTLLMGMGGTDPRTIQSKNAKMSGNLERIWEGAVGSSVNPRHSLSAVSMQASDSIFERVAVRKVLDANSPNLSDADYRIVDKLGEGGMGIVFTARQTAVDRLVALKVAKPKFQKSRDARKRFLYEAQITADLDHSNIVPIHELGASEDGMLFYSMKIVEGDQWSRVIGEKTREQNLDIFMKVADAVAFAHSKGIIHRDLKPENTMLGKFGEVFVTDWGTAVNLSRDSSRITEKACLGDRRLKVEKADYFRSGESIVIANDHEVLDRNEISAVQNNEIIFTKPLARDYLPIANLRVIKAFNLAGTPCYMAPEMAGHQLNKIGRTSDIYVLGAILFDMVIGRPPHAGPTVTHCLMNALGNELVIPDDAEDDALLRIALKAMASEPKERYETVEQMQDAVRQYRRHAESISLTDRSADLLAQAKETGDYQTYSRAMFGFRDAMELWPDNSAACEGLLTARLTYAEAAYIKGDFDLVLQTVDCSVPLELELFEKAQQAKRRRIERESRIRLLQRLVASVVMIAIVGLSSLLYYALNEQKKAVAAANAEKIAKLEAEEKKIEAESARTVAEQAQIKEEEQRKLAEQRQIEAEERRREAVIAQQAEILAKQDAQRKAIQIQLDEYKSSIALAGSRLASFDVRSAREILDGLLHKATNVSQVAPPAFDTWGWQRIRLLGNADLPQITIAGRVIASTSASAADVIAVATDMGDIHVYDADNGILTVVHTHHEPNANVLSLAISADGAQLVYAYSTSDRSGMKLWKIGKGIPESIRASEGKKFQKTSISRDGKRLVAGISAGLWIWNITTDGWLHEESPTSKWSNVRGELVALQEIADEEFLLTTDFNKTRELRLVNIATGSNDPITLPEPVRGSLVSCHHVGNGQLAMGLSDYRIVIANLQKTQLTIESFLELKHASAVTKIAQDKSGRLISMSDAEPVAQVWHKLNDRWQYESYLAGLRGNMVDMLPIPNGSLIGIDASNIGLGAKYESRAIVWNIKRQIQRIRMERPIENGRDIRYPESVQHIVVGGYDSQALSVDTNGCINVWNLLSGQISGPVFSYLGHTPGAELVDSVTSLDSQVLVTVAKLRNSQRAYVDDRNATWEFCLWDLESKQMIRRWTRTDSPLPGQSESTTVEPRLTLVDRGRKLLLGSDTHTTIIDVKTGEKVLDRSDWGTNFAIENPKNSSQLLLIKRSGAIRLLDLDQLRWNDGKIDNVSLILASEAPPMQAVWSANGKHFFIAYANGDIAKLAIIDQTARILWHSRALQNDASGSPSSLQLRSGEIRLHTDMDLLLKGDADTETIQYAIRTGSTDRRTHHVSLQFNLDSNKPISINQTREPLQGNRWLKFDDMGEIILTEELHESYEIDSRRVRVIKQLGASIFISSRTAQTYAIDRGSESIKSFARTIARSVTGDRSGRILYSLNADGAMTRFRLGDDLAEPLKNLNYALPNANEIRLSGDSRFLAALAEGNLSIHDPESGRLLYSLGRAGAIAWNPLADAELASCSADGKVTILDAGFQVLRQIPQQFNPGEVVVGIHFLTETFGVSGVAPRRHLMTNTRDAESDYVTIVPLDPLPIILAGSSGEQQHKASSTQAIRQPLTKNSLIAVSPTEGIFATGTDNGTVNVWYCSPTWGTPRELFDLSGHRGAKITAIVFSTDGRTLLTADDNKRLYAWITRDPQGHE